MKTEDTPHVHGWDEDHWEYGCSDGKHPSFWKTIVTSKYWEEWCTEVTRRMHEDDYKGAWDVDECRECNWISPKHFADFMRYFINKT